MIDEEIDRSNSDSVSSVEVGFRLIDELDNEWECRCDSYEERQNWVRLLSHTISHSTLPFLASMCQFSCINVSNHTLVPRNEASV